MAYVVVHLFNDLKRQIPVVEEEMIGFTDDPEDAQFYLEQFNEPFMYNPRSQLLAHQLIIVESDDIFDIPPLNLREPPQTYGWFMADRVFSEIF